MKPNYILPVAALVIAVLIWGIVPSLIRSLTLETGPADSVVIRMFTNAIFCLPLMFFAGWHIERQDWPRLLVLACICNFGYYVGSIYAFANLSAGAGGMLYATNPMMIVGLAIAVGQERLSLAVIMGMVISFIGTLVLFSGGLVGAGGNPLFGGLVMLAACFGWAVYVVFNRPLVKKYGPLRVTLYSVMLPVIPALLFLTPHTYTTFANLTPNAIIALVTMTLFGTILSVNLWNYASVYLPSSSCGASLYLIPPGAAVFGWLFLHETTGPQTLLGGLIILIGVAVAEFGKSFITEPTRVT